MRVALLCSEALRPKMAGIGIRYMEFARRLQNFGLDIVLIHPGEEDCGLELGANVECRKYRGGGLTEQVADCQVVVAQGSLADPLLADPNFQLPVVVDLYDPWLVENFVYLEPLGLEPYRRDQASWSLQLGRGDFFICSCEPQRLFYLGFLTALGRIRPERAAKDPDFRSLIDCVPFGLPDELAPFQPLLPNKREDVRHILFGCIYDWYDPITLLSALEKIEMENWQLHLVKNPNPDTTPQRLLAKVKKRCKELGWWDEKVVLHDWFPVERRFDLLRDMDLLVSPHHPDLETRLSLRTRFLDALVAECPVVATRGGAFSQELSEAEAGWLVDPGDAKGLATAIESALSSGPGVSEKLAAGRTMAKRYQWDKVLEPLVAYLQNPVAEPHRRVTKNGLGKRLSSWVRKVGR